MKPSLPIPLLFSMCSLLILLAVNPEVGVNCKKKYQKNYSQKKKECDGVCNYLHSEINLNCVNKCVSTECYLEIYQSSPLELGEVDNTRSRNFMDCVRKVERRDRQNKNKTIKEMGA